MALKVYKEINEHLTLGIWKIEEEVYELNQRVQLNQKEEEIYKCFKTDRRKKEWLATRELLRNMNIEEPIKYMENGKPYLANRKLSISHTKNRVGVTLNTKFHCGVDIEAISNKAFRVKSKFVHFEEEPKQGIPALSDDEYFTLLWAIKEAVFKRFSHEESLEFKNGIRLTEIPNSKLGKLSCKCSGLKVSANVSIQFELTNEYALAYTLD